MKHKGILAGSLLCGLAAWTLQPAVAADDGADMPAPVTIGARIFADPGLSASGDLACATCHDPAAAFASKDTVAIGVRSKMGTRNVPTILNAKFGETFFWDGRVRTLEEQAKQPLLNVSEMGFESEAALVNRLSSIAEYQKQFRRFFPSDVITLDTVAKAIAAYERTLVSNNSPFDRFIKGDQHAITENQKAGWLLFKGKAKCIECHTFSAPAQLFTDFKFYNTGVARRNDGFEKLTQQIGATKNFETSSLAHQPEFSELGRFLVTNEKTDMGAFKTPTLRDVELTGPYMHNGSLRTLLDVVRFYNQGGQKNPNLNNKIHPLDLNENEINQLVEFLRSLTSDDVLRQVQTSTPQTRTAVAY